LSKQDTQSEKAYALARGQFATLGVDTDAALAKLSKISVSLHCWQGDDVGGFEPSGVSLGGGLVATGNYPGKARTPDELRSDAAKALSLIPGKHRFNLQASYAETGGKIVERNALKPSHFQGWIDWAKEQQLGLDFNPTFFSHPNADDGFTLAHGDKGIREFWIEHGIVCRHIGAAMGRALGSPCVTNVWVPDGYKDTPVDRHGPRERLAKSLDTIFAEPLDANHILDSVEAKLFGIGSESYVVGSHEFYFGYAVANRKVLCLDAGHFHPTEVISDKISSAMQWLDRLLLHVSRGVRWDSDHVVTMTDELQAIAHELVRNDYLGRTHLGLDYFDASINRVAAWAIGTRNLLKALLIALLEPIDTLRQMEQAGDFTARLALLEDMKLMPFGAVWHYHCLQQGVPPDLNWMQEVCRYEEDILAKRI